jgi:hypothetical protein
VHARPHAPQCAVVLLVFTSQPLAAIPSQLAKPIAQLATAHTPATHEGVALASAHARPQPPQCATVVSVFTSQPLIGLASQFPKPALHAPSAHAPAEHTALALERAGHGCPHPPQCAADVCVFTSHPSPATALQSPNPGLHRGRHAPALHSATPFAATPQRLPHTPQCSRSVIGLTHERSPIAPVGHRASPMLGHGAAHVPPAHTSPAMHALPHVPQLLAAVRRSVSQPLAALLSQSPKPVAHAR